MKYLKQFNEHILDEYFNQDDYDEIVSIFKEIADEYDLTDLPLDTDDYLDNPGVYWWVETMSRPDRFFVNINIVVTEYGYNSSQEDFNETDKKNQTLFWDKVFQIYDKELPEFGLRVESIDPNFIVLIDLTDNIQDFISKKDGNKLDTIQDMRINGESLCISVMVLK